ncbi:MAG: ChuX/HutX family heme-like substrate-binding protein [Pseudomonadota bacterium]
MTVPAELSPDDIRALQKEKSGLRARDLAEESGISEAALVAARVGRDGVTRVASHPNDLIAAVPSLGPVMALTRNRSAVHEKTGAYDNFHPGNHASMVLTEDIDLRMFPSHWAMAFAVEDETDQGTRRSLQVFDKSGDAVHKVYLRDGSDLAAWDPLVRALKIDDQSDTFAAEIRQPPEIPKGDAAKADALRAEWVRMTDTHQFMRVCSKLKMNRLGAYRIAGEPHARSLPVSAVDTMFEALRDRGTEVMLFVGNRGCIQIHSGPIKTLKPMGPWQNVLDPGFNLHLRADHVAEVWAVDKPTQRGNAVSVETFDADGALIFQVFGIPKEGRDSRPEWRKIVAELPTTDKGEA